MELMQKDVAEQLGVSPSQFSQWRKRGCPPDLEGARRWRGGNIAPRKRRGVPLAPGRALLPRYLPPSADPTPARSGKLSPAEVEDLIQILKDLIADGAGDERHPQHGDLCTGVRIAFDFGGVTD